MEFLLEVIESVPGMFKTLPNTEEVYLKTLFIEIHLPVIFLCICELAHECIGLYDEDDVFLNEKLKIKSSIQRFWTWLSQRRYLCHDFLQPAGIQHVMMFFVIFKMLLNLFERAVWFEYIQYLIDV